MKSERERVNRGENGSRRDGRAGQEIAVGRDPPARPIGAQSAPNQRPWNQGEIKGGQWRLGQIGRSHQSRGPARPRWGGATAAAFPAVPSPAF